MSIRTLTRRRTKSSRQAAASRQMETVSWSEMSSKASTDFGWRIRTFFRITLGRGATGTTVPLVENFRSREGIVNFINSFFPLVMRPEIGGVSYDEEARLRV